MLFRPKLVKMHPKSMPNGPNKWVKITSKWWNLHQNVVILHHLGHLARVQTSARNVPECAILAHSGTFSSNLWSLTQRGVKTHQNVSKKHQNVSPACAGEAPATPMFGAWPKTYTKPPKGGILPPNVGFFATKGGRCTHG